MNSKSDSRNEAVQAERRSLIRLGAYALMLPFAIILLISGYSILIGYGKDPTYRTPLEAFFGALSYFGFVVLALMIPTFSMSVVGAFIVIVRWRAQRDWFGAVLCIFPIIGVSALIWAQVNSYNEGKAYSERMKVAAATATRSVDPSQAPEAEALLATAKQWSPILTDTFDLYTLRWPVGRVDIGKSSYLWRRLIKGKYAWTYDLDGMGFDEQLAAPGGEALKKSDCYIAMDMDETNSKTGPHGPGGIEIGLWWGEDEDSSYTFQVEPRDGAFSLRYGSPGKDTVIKYTKSDLVRRNQVNHLAVVNEGSKVFLFVNDKYLGTWEGKPTKCEQVRIDVLYEGDGSTAEIHFDNFEVRAP